MARRAAAAKTLRPELQKLRDARYLKYPGDLVESPAGHIVDLAMTPVDASATEVRRLLAQPTHAGRRSTAWRHRSRPRSSTIFARITSTPGRMDIRKLQRVIVDALEDVKGQDIQVFNTTALSDMFDRVVIASGTSNRQTRALASSVAEKVKAAGGSVVSMEGEDTGDWVLVDCGDAVVHILQPAIRDYYNLEEIWGGKSVRLKSCGRRVDSG